MDNLGETAYRSNYRELAEFSQFFSQTKVQSAVLLSDAVGDYEGT